MGRTIYQAGEFIIKAVQWPHNRPYKVINLKGDNLHTHLRSEKEARDAVGFVRNKKIPRAAKIDYLESLKRITKDEKLKRQITHLIEIKIDKAKGNQKNYINPGVKKTMRSGRP